MHRRRNQSILVAVLATPFAPPALAAASDHGAPVFVPLDAAPAIVTLNTPSLLAAERSKVPYLTQIKADRAWAAGATGRGVVVGVIDTGVRGTHGELAGKVANGRDVTGVTRAPGTVDIAGHGTHVAGIIAGRRDGRGTHGVAWEATILPVQVFMRTAAGLGASDAAVATGIRHTIGRAPIVNLSLGAGSALGQTEAALREGVRAGALYTIAAGNAGRAAPDWPARYAKEGWANGQIIAVGAVDSSNRIASFSNRAGDTRSFYLVAPGVGLQSAYNTSDTAYASLSGTSMAAPAVAGAAALVKSRWTYLTAQQVAGTLFRTATDLGAPGVDDTYGWGLVNLERAMQPVGTLGIQFANGRIVGVQAIGGVSLGSATGARVSAGLRSLSVAALDDLGRDFQVSVAPAVQARPLALSAEQMFGTSDRTVAWTDRVLDRNGSRYVALTDAAADLNRVGAFHAYENRARGDQTLIGAAMLQRFDDGSEVAFGTGGMQLFFGLAGADLPGAPVSAMNALSNPVLGLVPQATSFGYGRSVEGVKVKLGFASSALTGALADQFGMSLGERSSNLALREVSRRFGTRAELGLAVGTLAETGAHLGGTGTGVFALTGTTTTTTWAAHAAWRIADDVALAGHYAVGFTNATSGDGLITNVSAVRADAFGIGLVWSKAFRPGDRLSVSMSQPLRAGSGAMTLVTPTGMSDAGAMQYTVDATSLAATGRELLTELNYSTPLGPTDSVGVSFIRRRNPGNDASLPAEHAVGIRYGRVFR